MRAGGPIGRGEQAGLAGGKAGQRRAGGSAGAKRAHGDRAAPLEQIESGRQPAPERSEASKGCRCPRVARGDQGGPGSGVVHEGAGRGE